MRSHSVREGAGIRVQARLTYPPAQVRWRLMTNGEGSDTKVLRVMMVGCAAAQSFAASLSEKEKKHFGDGSSGGKGL